MRMERKQILKDDGRYLVYYHFPDSASPNETDVFNSITEGETLPSTAPVAVTPSGTVESTSGQGGTEDKSDV